MKRLTFIPLSGLIVVLVVLLSSALFTKAAALHATGSKKMGQPNRLINEKSPYLLQHADNPVDWYPWGDEAFEKARREDKPILLSIGYSTCHWCHVMEHESFEDPDVAKLMNETFVSIKVDREERPDIDNIYMTVCQMISKGNCGWPLNIIMTPDNKPFFAATYIPKEARFGRAGMLDLIPRVRDLWATQREEVLKSADHITSALQQGLGSPVQLKGEELDESALGNAYDQLAGTFDSIHGGIGRAPKFPTPHNYLFLLRYWKRSGNKNALAMVEKTLQSMRLGGIYDHVGFGFHRYSTDPNWLVPHFEKMLYDQAMLAMAYIEAYQATGKKDYEQTAREIFAYVLRDMTDPDGGFYSAEDADSEGEEGKFYLWSEKEIGQVLGKDDAEIFIEVFNTEKEGNFGEEATGRKTGENILYLKKPVAEIALSLNLSEADLHKRIQSAREKLFNVREKRVHPHKDDKVLTDWNGLMIAALAKGAQAFDEPKYAVAAGRAVDFILKNLRDKNGKLLHRYRDGESGIRANLTDYAFLVWGLTELYEATFDVDYLKTALELNNELIKNFWDDANGGFYFTSNEVKELIVRQKEINDGAIPSGNSVAMLNLVRLGRMTADPDLEKKAAKIGDVFSNVIERYPSAFTQLLVALDFGIGPSYEVVIAGDYNADDTKAMLNALRREFLPNKVVLFRASANDASDISRFAEYAKNHASINGKATAYVCLNYECKLPTTDVEKMLELLNTKQSRQEKAS